MSHITYCNVWKTSARLGQRPLSSVLLERVLDIFSRLNPGFSLSVSVHHGDTGSQEKSCQRDGVPREAVKVCTALLRAHLLSR